MHLHGPCLDTNDDLFCSTTLGFGGPSSTLVALKRADRVKDTTVPAKTWDDLLNEKWYATKEQLNEEKGLALGLHSNTVRPHSSLGCRLPAPETLLPKEELHNQRKAA